LSLDSAEEHFCRVFLFYKEMERMIVVLKENPQEEQLNNLISWLKNMGLNIHFSEGINSTILGLVGDTSRVDIDLLKALDIVEDVKRIQEPYKNANRKFHPNDTEFEVGGVKIGGGTFNIIAGPCSIETTEQICSVALSALTPSICMVSVPAPTTLAPILLRKFCKS
jgi:3-deoxy-7-phosphoheptulonate synthase